MAWDTTFDWADKTSFRGEGRKLAILTELVKQTNIKCEESPLVENIPSIALGDSVLNTARDIHNKIVNELAEMYYNPSLSGTWTEETLDTDIGNSIGLQNGNRLLTATWINWIYEALNRFLYIIELLATEYWSGYLGNSGDVVDDIYFSWRWPTATTDNMFIDHFQFYRGYDWEWKPLLTMSTSGSLTVLEGRDDSIPILGHERIYMEEYVATPSVDTLAHIRTRGCSIYHLFGSSTLIYLDPGASQIYTHPGWTVTAGGTPYISINSTAYFRGRWDIYRYEMPDGLQEIRVYFADYLNTDQLIYIGLGTDIFSDRTSVYFSVDTATGSSDSLQIGEIEVLPLDPPPSATLTELWDGTESNSGVWKDDNFNARWPYGSTSSGASASINTTSETITLLTPTSSNGGISISGGTPGTLRYHDTLMKVALDYNPASIGAYQLMTHSNRFCYLHIRPGDSITLQINQGSWTVMHYPGAYEVYGWVYLPVSEMWFTGTWKFKYIRNPYNYSGGTLTVYFNDIPLAEAVDPGASSGQGFSVTSDAGPASLIIGQSLIYDVDGYLI